MKQAVADLCKTECMYVYGSAMIYVRTIFMDNINCLFS